MCAKLRRLSQRSKGMKGNSSRSWSRFKPLIHWNATSWAGLSNSSVDKAEQPISMMHVSRSWGMVNRLLSRV